MINVCVLAGPVLTNPEFKSCDGAPYMTFYMGITIGPHDAGFIQVCFPPKLATLADIIIRPGERVVVHGVIGRYEPEGKKSQVPLQLVLMAEDFEMLRRYYPRDEE